MTEDLDQLVFSWSSWAESSRAADTNEAATYGIGIDGSVGDGVAEVPLLIVSSKQTYLRPEFQCLHLFRESDSQVQIARRERSVNTTKTVLRATTYFNCTTDVHDCILVSTDPFHPRPASIATSGM